MKYNYFATILMLFLATVINAQDTNSKEVDSIAKSISDKAWSFIEKESDSALYYVDKGIAFSKENNSKYGEIVNLEIRGLYFASVENDYKAAAKVYLEALKLAEKYHTDYLAVMNTSLCQLYASTGDFKRAIGYCENAVLYSKENTRIKSGTMINLGILQSKLGKYEEANKTFKSILKDNKLHIYGLNVAKGGMAANLRRLEKYKEAMPYYKEILVTDSLKGSVEYRSYYAGIIDNAIDLNDKKILAKYLDVFKKSFQTKKSLDDKQNYFITISNALQTLGNYKDAAIYKDSLIEINKELHTKKYDESIVETDIKYQTEKKEEQIKAEKGKQQFWLLIAGLSILTLLVVVFSLYKNNQKRKQLAKSTESLEIALNQRNMLLRETHHRVKNSFQMVSSLLQLQAQGSKVEGAVKALDNAVQRVNSMIILHQQLYAKDNILGINLKTYINDLTIEITRSYEAQKININQQILATSVNIDTATSIGLLVNELATNSIKHAWNNDVKDRIITIQIKEVDNMLNFKMFDNGKNKKDNTLKSGYGSELIEILIDRLEAIKQKTEQDSFTLHIKIPFLTNEV